MTTFGVDLGGVESLDAALAAVAKVLTDPLTAEAGTDLIAASARPLVPTDSGALVTSERVTATGSGARLVYTARYSVIVQARQPWLGAGISGAIPQLLALYENQVQDAWT